MSTSPANRPQEDWNTIFLERNFLAGDCITSVGYGIQFVLFISCVRYLWGNWRERASSRILLVYISVIFVLSTMFLGVQARTVQLAYIDNRNFPGGPWAWFLSTQELAVNVIFYATFFLMTFLADALVLWRCWVIWTSSGRLVANLVVAFPALLLFASFAMGTLWTLQSSKPGLSLYSTLPLAFGTAYYVISVSTNIILTILTSLRLLLHRRTVLQSLAAEHAAQYVSILTIIIESAALYTVFAIPFLITYALNHPLNQSFLGLASSAQPIAAYLIIYRVAQGNAWSKDTKTAAISSIHFGAKPAIGTVLSHHDSEMSSATLGKEVC